MPFPFLANYPWGSQHFSVAQREHDDLSDIAKIFNNIRIQAVRSTDLPSIEKNGTNWIIKVPTLSGTSDGHGITIDGHYLTLQQVSICVANETKKMLILGSEPY